MWKYINRLLELKFLIVCKVSAEDEEIFPFACTESCGCWLTIQLIQDRSTGEKDILIYMHRGLIEIGPKMWPKQIAFTL